MFPIFGTMLLQSFDVDISSSGVAGAVEAVIAGVVVHKAPTVRGVEGGCNWNWI